MAQNSPHPEKPMPGAPQLAPQDDPLVLEAKEFVQKHLAILHIEEIKEARTQVVAGRNVRLICRVKEEQGEGTWEFLAHRPLNGCWQLLLAKRLDD